MTMTPILFILSIVFISLENLEAKIENYFKKPAEKSDIHRMKNIDYIYMINLDERPEKYLKCIQQLHPYGVYPYRFPAVNGWKLTLEAINDLGVKYEPWMEKELLGTCFLLGNGGKPRHEVMQEIGRNYFCHHMSRGTIGIVLSHLSILQDAYDSGYNTIWVMEDDIQVIQNPNIISELIEKLDNLTEETGWDILFTDQNTKNRAGIYVPCVSYSRRPNFVPKNPERFSFKEKAGSEFWKIGARYGAYSMIVRRSGMKMILDFIKRYRIFLPYDMDFYQPSKMRIYTVVDDIVSTEPKALSDNGAPNYLKKKGKEK